MININYSDAGPIYEKVKDSLRRLMLSGVLPPDSKLPSVRELAMQLSINPNTIQRAYRALEQAGYIDSAPGKGNFAALQPPADAGRRAELVSQLQKTARALRDLGMTEAEIAACLEEGGERE